MAGAARASRPQGDGPLQLQLPMQQPAGLDGWCTVRRAQARLVRTSPCLAPSYERGAHPVVREVFAVTTRSRLRSARFFPAMALASWRIRRQLATADGLLRSASFIASPTEFWTVTVWRSRDAMQEFARSGPHGRFMWQVSRWLRSFWLMRWQPGSLEVGSWNALMLERPGEEVLAHPTGESAADIVFADIPELRAALGPSGAPSYANAPLVRRQRAKVEGAGGVLMRVEVAPHRMVGACVELLRLRRRLAADPDLLRAAVGVGRVGEVCLLAVWRNRTGPARLFTTDWVRTAATRWPGGFWASEWTPENEFGQWDGLRLRTRIRTRSAGRPSR